MPCLRRNRHLNSIHLELLIILQLIIQPQLREIPDLYPLRAQENAALGRAREVLGSVDAAVVLARGLVQHYTYPRSHAGNVWDGADEGDGAATVVGGGEDAAAEAGFDAWSSC